MASMNTLQKAALAVVGLATFGFAFGSAVVAEAHTTPVAQAYITVAWEMPKAPVNETSPTWPQTYYRSTKTKTPTLNALDSSLRCNVHYQVDVYVDNDITKELIKGKHLDGPNNPKEDLVPGGWGVSYKLVYVNCSTPTPTTPVPTTTTPVPTTTTPVPTTTTPVPTTTTPVPTTTTPVPTTTTPTVTVTTQVPTNPASPPVKVTYSMWMWPVATCGSVVVTQSRVVTTTPWILVNGAWVPDNDHATSVTEYRDHLLVGDEVLQFQSQYPDAPCYVTPVSTPTPTFTAHTATLANTGAPSMLEWALIFGLVTLGAGGGILFLKKYKAEDADTESDN